MSQNKMHADEVDITAHWEMDHIWIHGDLHAGNLLAKDQKVVGVVDWGLAGVRDPYYRDTNPIFASIAKRTLDQVIADSTEF